MVLALVAAALLAAPEAASQVRGPFADLAAANKLIAEGRPGDAEAILVALTEVVPESPSVWYSLALSRKQQGKAGPALIAIKTALQRNEKMAEAQLLAAELHAAAGRQHQARTHAQKAVATGANDLGLAKRVAKVLLDASAFEAAEKILVDLVKKHPREEDLLRLQAKVALGAGKPKLAVAAYRGLVVLKPRDPGLLESLGNVYAASKQRKKALETYRQLLSFNPSNNAVRKRLIALMDAMKVEPEAIRKQRLYLTYYLRAVSPETKKKRAEAKAKRSGTKRFGTRRATPPKH